ncbi:MAG TPA: hypothetical protein VNQ77_19840 [Frankiaceae bacterium]|nr:hypothetical protein [Frankiaceae bacterium]
MRTVAVLAVLSLVLGGCGGSPADPGAAPSSAPASTKPAVTQSDLARVLAAVKATRAKKTATFVIKGTTSLAGGGSVTVRRDGKYDLAAKRSFVEQTMTESPAGLLSQLVGKDVKPGDLDSRSYVTTNGGYLQMPGWPEPAHAKWLRFTAAEVERMTDVSVDVESSIFPAGVSMLADAERSAHDGADEPAMAHVVVPASAAFLAFPSSSTRSLITAGVDPTKITGEVEVEVAIQDGLVTGVWFDALPAFAKAYEQIGQPRVAKALSELSTVVDLRAHGSAAKISLPPAGDVMTDAEFKSYF